jgi:hypothetical protein
LTASRVILAALADAEEFPMTMRARLIASAAALFALGSVATAADAEGTIKCGGINSCKGTSSCKTASSSCKGQNSCKGMGWTQTSSASECTAKGGKVI